MTKPLYKLGALAARHPLPFIALWVVLIVSTVVVANSVGRPTNNNLDLPGTGSTEATDVLAKGLPKQANGSVQIVLEATSGKLTSGANRKAVQETVKSLRNDRYVNQVISPLSQQGADALTDGGRLGFISVFLSLSSGDLSTEEAEQIFDRAGPARRAGLEVDAGGYLGQQLSVPDTSSSDRLGVLVAIVILLVAFGTAVAMALPITTAVSALLVGLALVGFLGHVIDVPQVAPTLGTMLGLAVGIDYSLFILSRHQRQLREGMDPHESVARAIATSGSAVVFAGSTVIVALLCLYFGGVELVRSLGYSAALVVLVAVISALTLLPALLGLLGKRLESLSIPFLKGAPSPEARNTLWARWSALIGRRPLPFALAGGVLLVVLAIPIFQLQLGSIDYGQYPTDTTERRAYDKLTSGFGVGLNAPLLIAVEFPADDPAKPNKKKLNQVQQQADEQQQQAQEQQEQQQQAVAAGEEPPPTAQQQQQQQQKQQQQQQQLQQQEQFLSSPASDPRLTKLEKQIQNTKDVKSTSPAQVNKSGTTAVFSAIPGSGPAAERTRDLVAKLRDEVIPNATQGNDLTAFVGGQTAAFIDLAEEIADRLVLVILIVVVLGFVLLAAAFRSIVIPALAALLNLLAVVAAYGILTAVFELGWGVELIGLDRDLPVVSFVPLLMFAILFGLAMDYQVFLLTRTKEVWDKTRDEREAVVGGLRVASRVIVAAATIMFAVFASFILNGDPTVKQFGVGLAVAVALDAIVVIAMMPALLLLVGRAAWWFPSWLERIVPNVGIEGEQFFEELDRERDGVEPRAEPAGRAAPS